LEEVKEQKRIKRNEMERKRRTQGLIERGGPVIIKKEKIKW
jgi:hypothetical protein